MRLKGIVLEIDEKGAILINNEGNYIRIRNKKELIPGVLVEYSESDVINTDKKQLFSFLRENSKLVYAFGSAAVFIFIVALFAIISRQAVNETFAYIDVDINPSIELKINKDSSIIGVKTLNKDGEELCQNIDFIGKKAENGVMDIINKSAELGYFQDKTKLVLVAGALMVDEKISSDKYQKLNIEMGSLIEKIKDRIKKEKKELQLVAFHTSPIKLKEAHQNNMSLGRYSIYANADNQGIKLALEDAKSLKISELFNLLPTKDYTYFEEEQRQAAIDSELIKENNGKPGISKLATAEKESGKSKQNKEGAQGDKKSHESLASSNNSIVTVTPSLTPTITPLSDQKDKNKLENDKSNDDSKKDDEKKSDNIYEGNDNNKLPSIVYIHTPAPTTSLKPSDNKESHPIDEEDNSRNNNGNGNGNKDNNAKNNNKHTPNPVATTPTPEATSLSTASHTPTPGASNTSTSHANDHNTPVHTPSAVISTPVPTSGSGKNESGKSETAPGQVKKGSTGQSDKGQGNKNGKN
ncbi:MAG TPA: hypothetical protein VIO64_03230 [Pseudobacteroides sp.]|uniref:anti-sigma-I factor RsgI family protein n=1 Tax=Pseudobacteroides sp. TaxID=1968840 RepID=UPI002F94C5C0